MFRYLSVFLFWQLSFVNLFSQSEFIHVDQFGYLTSSEKVAVISDPQTGFNAAESYVPGSTLEVKDFATNLVVYSGSPLTWNSGSTHAQSGDKGWWFDFSTLSTPGRYYIHDPSSGEKSAPFEINANPYLSVLYAATKMFYYNRCNATKENPYADVGWTDGMNFAHPLQDANCRDINDPGNASKEKELTGGWFDAGDYNKYVTFAHHPVHQLLWTYEDQPGIFGDDWNLPESGNGLADILDEIKYELDWLMKMSNADGTVHIKMGSNSHNQNAGAPPSVNTDPRYYGPTCTSASVASASMLAHAAKVFNTISGMSEYVTQLESKAIVCWNAFMGAFNTNSLETNCDDLSIVAGDADWSTDEQLNAALIAAVFLFDLTSQNVYADFVNDHYGQTEPISTGFWGPYQTDLIEALLTYTTLNQADTMVSNSIRSSASTAISNNWNGFFQFSSDDLYRAASPDWIYHWGSNLPKANIGNLCHILKKYNVSPASNDDLEEKAAEQLHYFHGINPLGIMYLSNMYGLGGDRCINEIYHTWFNDGTLWDHAINSEYGPPPGYVPGGPNQQFSIGSISPPAGQPVQKSYLDFNTGWPDNSWEISEPAIYYQAAYIRLLARYVNTQQTTSVTNLKALSQCIEVYPNPSGNYFHIKGVLENFHLEIYDSLGTLHQTVDPLGSEAVINIQSLPSGTYLLKVENLNNNELCVQKILKN